MSNSFAIVVSLMLLASTLAVRSNVQAMLPNEPGWWRSTWRRCSRRHPRMRPIRWAMLALLWAFGARADLSPRQGAALSAGVSIPAIAAGALLAESAAQPNGPGRAPGQFAVGLIIAGAGVIVGPSVGRLATGIPAGKLILVRVGIVAMGAGIVALLRPRDYAPPEGAVAVAVATGAAVCAQGIYDIATTPADVRALRAGPVIAPIPGGLALAMPF